MDPVLLQSGLRGQWKQVLDGTQRVQLQVREQLGQRALGFGFAQQVFPARRLGGSGCGDGHHGGLVAVLVDGAQVSWRAVSEPWQRRFQVLWQRRYDLPMDDAALAPALSLADPAAGFIDDPHPDCAAPLARYPRVQVERRTVRDRRVSFYGQGTCRRPWVD